jgi:hypothetical protein
VKNIWALCHDLENHPPLKRQFQRVREEYKRKHPSASKIQIAKRVIAHLFAEAPSEAREALATMPDERDIQRRLGQLELAKSRTHGLEWTGELTGGNYGARF